MKLYRTLKYIHLVTLLTVFLGLFSCSNKDALITPYEEYVASPKTEVGRKLVENTDLIATIQSDSSYSVVSGVEATELSYLSSTGLAMKIFVFEVDLSASNISIEASTPNNSPVFGMQPMTKQATFEDANGHMVWGGVNGDFYNMSTGVPQGVLHKEGIAIKSSVTDEVNTFFGILEDGRAVIGDQDTYAQVKGDLMEAVGGRVKLLENGATLSQSDTRLEPRTAIGVSEDGMRVIMLVADGRNFHYSNGMTYDDLGKSLKALGAYNAINLDGGGSSTFFTRNTAEFTEGRFEVRNWPTDNGGEERAVANGLLIISSE